ncbi:exodeoxyribonuclease V subunit beta [Parashewanella spongiae]|uniref:RecBCD enzyme subunit RecB n=1 Tax=Parashewanella spongiae TaxID=342950 RepID=A0A3A6TWU5_9GAMM|nr:exodeoxyribonuclease V subunit beta [Parashewanella spongiae]MCL1078232.1 exodeoxyribonuclease V subunit beta [Parashewanella spongiae]RJY16300.1 exodeoxyribonuclease V subunit beta [Parashewanella spongiae]
MSQAQVLNPLTIPLYGKGLIEASAGTGKTYTISGIYLRLLLGRGVNTPLTCQQILVVTFTNAATEELRDRIRNRIRATYHAFLGLECNDDFINQLLKETPKADKQAALKRLDLALKSLDESSIFTIHGFCQRILTDMAFESSLLFETEFTLDDSEYMHHAVRDYWRQYCYTLPPEMAQVIQNEFSDPDTLIKQLRPLLNSFDNTPLVKPGKFSEVSEKLTQSLSQFKARWPSEHNSALKQLMDLPLSGVRFGKKSDGYPKLIQMFDRLNNWANYGVGFPPKKEMEMLALSNIKLNKGGVLPHPKQAKLLAHIERINELTNQIKPAFLYQALTDIRERFAQQKIQKNVLTPDDLLTQLSQAISQNSESLPQQINQRFPVALIDEFQDTDPLQFNIFSKIYQHTDQSGLLMIGDPKQAIYAFRGADIHTYINARNQTNDQYFLAKNWRSSTKMVEGVNELFKKSKDPFINAAIPFEAVSTPPNAANKVIQDSENDLSALRIRLLSEEPEKGLNKTTARKILAEDAAEEIVRLLNESESGQSSMSANANDNNPIKAKDIAILVRDRNEAAVIKQALIDRNVGSVFLSRDSVLNCLEAQELAIILRSFADPKNERLLRSALATKLFGFTALQIDQFNNDETLRQQLLEQCFELHNVWHKRGIMPTLLTFAKNSQLIARLLNDEDGGRRLTDFRHLSEILQQKSTEIDGVSALLAWYEQQLVNSNNSDDQQLRLESEQNLVQIVTIHKSKGLEYPVCFVPFVSLARDNRRRPSPMIYHLDGKLTWDIEQTDEGWEKQKRETLAEDLRLLYVALTRPVYRCYLAIANHSRFTKKSGLSSQLFETAIGYLLGVDSKDCDFDKLQEQALSLQSEAINISTINVEALSTTNFSPKNQATDEFTTKELNRMITTPWRVGSYSGLVKHQTHERVHPGADDEGLSLSEAFSESQNKKEIIDPFTKQDRFNFEKGANAGSFMHLVLELIDFTNAKSDLETHLPAAMLQYGIDEQWTTPLMEWYLDLLGSPLNSEGLCLYKLPNSAKLVEMEFYLPIKKLKATQVNKALQDFGYGDNLVFDDLIGMLKGFIDLTFEFNGKYYIADYKSNHLGDDFECYSIRNMSQAILDHRYDLQYILYTLALHRYLKPKIDDYNYDKHIGGCYYLFLRGMSANQPKSGIYYDKPPLALINRLDELFMNGTETKQDLRA